MVTVETHPSRGWGLNLFRSQMDSLGNLKSSYLASVCVMLGVWCLNVCVLSRECLEYLPMNNIKAVEFLPMPLGWLPVGPLGSTRWS